MSWLNSNKSEVARLRQQIEDECEAIERMSDFAVSASHGAIRQRYNNLGAAKSDLAKIVGEEEATKVMGSAYMKRMGGGR